ncbi:hypothetical protein AXF42_Ash001374 [Apostasia shenzhenica]|uniref:Uncharacterized protein n=1 Tax=Apostasia shenzhenica TaxID=1088818 RepID=A0A2I0AUQ5_9ASPA|nr:hypothetical protein AXF42_Ash001374 [Apostasia shenzhenica]
MNGSKLRFFAPLGAKKERDEELALFRELFKREREKNMNLLESVSADIEPIEGNSTVFKISTGKMGDSLTNEGEKNDYDWLKTPPATPLFQSLEMDVVQANAAVNTTVHKELPIIPPLKPSRFSSKLEEPKQLPKSPSSPSISSLSSSSSSRNEISDMQILSPPKIILTPRLIGVQDSLSSRMTSTLRFNRIQDPSQECIKGPYEEAPPKPVQTQRLVGKNAEPKPRPKSPSSSRPSTAASSRPETPESNANMNQKYPPSRVKVDRTVISRGKTVSNSTEKSTKKLSKEVPIKQAQGTKLQTPRV